MTTLAKHLQMQASRAGSVCSDAKKAAALRRVQKLWADRRAGRAPLPVFKRYLEEPCLDAEQIGATVDGKAVWRRGNWTFRVAWAEDDTFELWAVPEDQITTRHVRPIPWAEILKQQETTSTTKEI